MSENKSKDSSSLQASKEDRVIRPREPSTKKPKNQKTNKGKKNPQDKNKTFLLRIGIWSLTLLIWSLIILGSITLYFTTDLPDIKKLSASERLPSIKILAADGQAIAAYGDVYGESLSLKRIPSYLPEAIMATEDRRFYQHHGIDPIGLLRALWVDLRTGHMSQGGSTLTQQLAKNLFLSPARNIRRKIQELILAFWLERQFTKDEIMTLYLNRVYMGSGIWGVDAAARQYFGISGSQLSLYQCALLAGLLKAPSHYNPQNDMSLSEKRTWQVLINMVNAGYITEDQAKLAKQEGPGSVRQSYFVGRYFADWVRESAIQYVGDQKDIIVQTSLDLTLQKKAEEEMEKILSGPGQKAGVSQGAMVILTPDGAVKAMVGGRDYGHSQFNRVVMGLRQPGSSFKAFLYLAALYNGSKIDDLIDDSPIETGPYRPENYSHKYEGPITLKEAFAKSSNVAAVRLIEKIGPKKVITMAHNLGITATLNDDASLALGTSEVKLLEMTAGYAAFDNNGVSVIPYGFKQILSPKGEVLYERSGTGSEWSMNHQILSDMTTLLTAVVTEGTGKGAALDRPVGGKTGTTQDYRDAWFIGMTADYVAGVWLGNDDGTPLNKITGGSLPTSLWHNVLQFAEKSLPPRPLPGQLPEIIQSEQ